MRKYIIPEEGVFYKANLHCHSTVSDGKLTPEEIKREYKKRGYSVVAYTDHDLMVPHDDLTDGSFLALHGYEMEIWEKKTDPYKFRKACHICLIAIDPDTDKQVCWHREKYMVGHGVENRHLAHFDESLPDYEREYSPECVNDMIKKGRDNGFFVTYNHPVWSLQDYSDYMKYENMNAMEICNYTCFVGGYTEYNGKIYDDMLRGGKRIFCIAADDNHDKFPIGHGQNDSFGAFTVIKAPSLEYREITKALLAGNFYASQGPEIKELYYEDGYVYVKTSSCERIILTTGTRYIKVAVREKGKVLNKAAFEVKPDEDFYFRITVEDKKGLHADSNACFFDTL